MMEALFLLGLAIGLAGYALTGSPKVRTCRSCRLSVIRSRRCPYCDTRI